MSTEIKLPPMPEANWLTTSYGYTPDQMTAYATEAARMAYRQGLEDAEKVCELQASIQDNEQRTVVAHCCAAAIRALAEKEPGP